MQIDRDILIFCLQKFLFGWLVWLLVIVYGYKVIQSVQVSMCIINTKDFIIVFAAP